MPTSNVEELGLFLKCTVIGRGVFGPCACCQRRFHSDERTSYVTGFPSRTGSSSFCFEN